MTTDKIPITRQPASGTPVPTIRQGLWRAVPAQARLRRASGIDLYELPTGACCLVEQKHQELRPSGIVDGLRQQPAGESFHVQMLDGDVAVLIDDLPGFLVSEVGSLIGNTNVGALEYFEPLSVYACCLSRVVQLGAVRHQVWLAPGGNTGDYQVAASRRKELQSESARRRCRPRHHYRAKALLRAQH